MKNSTWMVLALGEGLEVDVLTHWVTIVSWVLVIVTAVVLVCALARMVSLFGSMSYFLSDVGWFLSLPFRGVAWLVTRPGARRRLYARTYAAHAAALRLYLSFEMEKAYEHPELIDSGNALVQRYRKALRQAQKAQSLAGQSRRRLDDYESAVRRLKTALEATEQAAVRGTK